MNLNKSENYKPDYLWQVAIKDPRYQKGYEKLSPEVKAAALDKYVKQAFIGRKIKHTVQIRDFKKWWEAKRAYKIIVQQYPELDWEILKYHYTWPDAVKEE